MKKLLTKEQISTILSMNTYWEEVWKREDKSPLADELREVIRMFGTGILFIIADYAKMIIKGE